MERAQNIFKCKELRKLTNKGCEAYYNHYGLAEDKRVIKSLLIDRKDAIKDPTVLLEVVDALTPAEYPFSFKKIKTILIDKINSALSK